MNQPSLMTWYFSMNNDNLSKVKNNSDILLIIDNIVIRYKIKKRIYETDRKQASKYSSKF